MDRSTKILVWYIGTTCLVEWLAVGATILYRNNLIIYHLYSIIQLFLISFYFNSVSKRFRKNNLMLSVGIVGIVIGILNSLFIQTPWKYLNTNFLMLESFVIIAMSLFTFYELLASDEVDIGRNPVFWFSALFLVFWSFTFFHWLIGLTMHDQATLIAYMIWSISVLIYSGFAVVFLSYRKMRAK